MEWHKQVDSKVKGEIELLELVLVAVCSIVGAWILSLPGVILFAIEHTMFVRVLIAGVALAFFVYLQTEICLVTCDILAAGH